VEVRDCRISVYGQEFRYTLPFRYTPISLEHIFGPAKHGETSHTSYGKVANETLSPSALARKVLEGHSGTYEC